MNALYILTGKGFNPASSKLAGFLYYDVCCADIVQCVCVRAFIFVVIGSLALFLLEEMGTNYDLRWICVISELDILSLFVSFLI